MEERIDGGMSGIVFMGLGTLVNSDMSLISGQSVFTTRHSKDFKMIDCDGW